MQVNSVSRSRRRGWCCGALLLLSGAALTACENKSKAAKGEEVAPVTLATVEAQDVPREVKAFGSVEPSSTVDIRSQVPGTVTQVHFHEGDFVKKGDPLFTIDTRPYSATLAAAQADLARSQAVADQARLEAERALRLR